jgi:prepilin-type N-terminal cleavage/methylation domain-containing protein
MQTFSRSKPTPRSEGGFTLIELLAVMTIIAILATALIVGIPAYIAQANDTACQANLRKIHSYFLQLRAQDAQKNHGPPVEGGVALLAYLWQKDTMEHTQTVAKTLACPAPGLKNLAAWVDEDGEVIGDPELIWGKSGVNDANNKEIREKIRQRGSDYSSYRVIDLSKGGGRWDNLLSGRTPIVCDGDPELAGFSGEGDPQQNHKRHSHVLYGDGSVETLNPDDIPELASAQGWEQLLLVGENASHSNGKYKNLVFNPVGRQ